MLKPYIILALCSLSLLFSSSAEAQSSTLERDLAEEVRILADNNFLDAAESVYRAWGNVRITQGSLLITANTLEITGFEQDDAESQLFLLAGTSEEPATYRQEIEDGLFVDANALRIEYDATNRILRLFGAAQLLQDGNVVRAESIVYDVESKSVNASRGDDEQVETIFRPRLRQQPENE